MTRGRRWTGLRLAALYVALNGVLGLLYAPYVPFFPPFVTTPNVVLSSVLGVIGLLAGLGIWRTQPWGRWLGVVSGAYWLAYGVVGILADLDGLTGGTVFTVIALGLELAVLWILVRRWPRPLPANADAME